MFVPTVVRFFHCVHALLEPSFASENAAGNEEAINTINKMCNWRINLIIYKVIMD